MTGNIIKSFENILRNGLWKRWSCLRSITSYTLICMVPVPLLLYPIYNSI